MLKLFVHIRNTANSAAIEVEQWLDQINLTYTTCTLTADVPRASLYWGTGFANGQFNCTPS